jgi:hypothetical protein
VLHLELELKKGDDHETYTRVLSQCSNSGDDLSCWLCICSSTVPGGLTQDSMLVAQSTPAPGGRGGGDAGETGRADKGSMMKSGKNNPGMGADNTIPEKEKPGTENTQPGGNTGSNSGRTGTSYGSPGSSTGTTGGSGSSGMSGSGSSSSSGSGGDGK